MVEPSQEPSENVLSSVHPSENVPSTPNVPLQDTLTSVSSASDSTLRPSMNFPSAANFSSTQNAGNKPSEMNSINDPPMRESPVDLSQKTSGNVSLMHNSIVHFSQEHSSDLKRVDDSAIDLSRRSSANVPVMYSLGILQSQEHLANDSSLENSVIASSQAGTSSNSRSGLEFILHSLHILVLVFSLAAEALTHFFHIYLLKQ